MHGAIGRSIIPAFYLKPKAKRWLLTEPDELLWPTRRSESCKIRSVCRGCKETRSVHESSFQRNLCGLRPESQRKEMLINRRRRTNTGDLKSCEAQFATFSLAFRHVFNILMLDQKGCEFLWCFWCFSIAVSRSAMIHDSSGDSTCDDVWRHVEAHGGTCSGFLCNSDFLWVIFYFMIMLFISIYLFLVHSLWFEMTSTKYKIKKFDGKMSFCLLKIRTRSLFVLQGLWNTI